MASGQCPVVGGQALSVKRSGDVTAAAIVLLFGSGIIILFAIADSLYTARAHTEVNWPRVLFIFGLLIVWGVATSIGILKLRPWARISIIVMSGGAIFICLIAAVAIMGAALEHSESQAAAAGALVAAMCAVPVGIGTWWVLLFTRKRIIAQFASGADSERVLSAATISPAAGTIPVSVVIIALWFFLGALVDFHAIFFRPLSTILVTVLGAHLRRYAAVCAFIVMMQLRTIIGIGLFYRARWARAAGIALCAYFDVNSVVTFILPGSLNRFANWVRSLAGQSLSLSADNMDFLRHLHVLALVIEMLVPTAVLYFLWSRRAAFYPPPAYESALSTTPSVPDGSAM